MKYSVLIFVFTGMLSFSCSKVIEDETSEFVGAAMRNSGSSYSGSSNSGGSYGSKPRNGVLNEKNIDPDNPEVGSWLIYKVGIEPETNDPNVLPDDLYPLIGTCAEDDYLHLRKEGTFIIDQAIDVCKEYPSGNNIRGTWGKNGETFYLHVNGEYATNVQYREFDEFIVQDGVMYIVLKHHYQGTDYKIRWILNQL